MRLIKRLNRKFKLLGWIIFILLIIAFPSWGQVGPALTLDSCQHWAGIRYPLTKQTTLIERASDYNLANTAKGMWPRLLLAGQASYQSEVTQVPGPETGIQPPAKDQYKMYGEINQPITEVFRVNQQKELVRVNTAIDQAKVEVELTDLEARINQIYFSILLLQAQEAQARLTQQDLELAAKKVRAAIANGTMLKSDGDQLQAEWLSADQRIKELHAAKTGFIHMLSLLIGKDLPAEVDLLIPPEISSEHVIDRPELVLYDLQKRALNVQQRLVDAENTPRVSLFLQGGYGRPALNVLRNDFRGYYLGGVRFTWNLANFYTSANEKQLLENAQKMQDVQEETFLLNTNLQLTQQREEIAKYQSLLETDAAIVALRDNIKSTAMAQLENGIITTNDYLQQVNAADKAEQNQLIHQIQLLLAQYTYQTISGN